MRPKIYRRNYYRLLLRAWLLKHYVMCIINPDSLAGEKNNAGSGRRGMFTAGQPRHHLRT